MKRIWELPSEGKLKPLKQDDQSPVMYAVALKSPNILSNNTSLTTTTSNHIFTENEVKRAAVRFYVETGETVRRKLAVGYVGVTTFFNSQGVLVTRHIVNLKERGEVFTVLFSSREFTRSMDRFKTMFPDTPRTWKERILGWFKK